jgi:4-hydroxy-2-oxoheptanedioate aldolase
MLSTNRTRATLADDGTVYGLICSIPSPTLVEMIGCAGYDFVVIDTEHTLVDPQQLENMIRAAEAVGVTPFVRVGSSGDTVDAAASLRALDAGALGIVVPHVRTADEAAAAVRAARYAPEGMRSVNGGRVPGFGRIDLVLEGAADLSQAYGVTWQTRHPRVRAALDHVAGRCAAHGVPFCAIPRTTEDHDAWVGRGVRAFVLGEERGLAARALRSHLAGHRGES